MSSKVYVGNLPFTVKEERLREIFSEYGNVQSVKIIMDEMGRSKGFAFVEFSSDEEAAQAAQSVNGKDIDGRQVKVEVARPQERRPRENRGGGFGGDRFGSRNDRRGRF